jgi:hypothetical protein
VSPGSAPADAALRTYFDGVATQTLDSLRAALGSARPGSPAAAYVSWLLASAQAAADSGHAADPAPRSAERTADGFTFRTGSGDAEARFDCTRITVAGDTVADFEVNGKPISGRLAVGDQGLVAVDGADATAVFVAAIEPTESDELLVAVRITSGAEIALEAVGASYGSAGGSASPSTDRLCPAVLDAGSTATCLFAFAGASVGGTLTLSLPRPDQEATVALEVGPPVGR